ncbi:glutamine--fructose-6-phosphate transaminase (isomerizing), partial [Bergeyella zoohelcum]|uniref:glutamine--fructose-6-phosphate transaminase (isomerizing) n=1 Tax=Bergeyella zoohelcum TaxID=1015 RepID=UPI0037367041
MCGIVGYTGFRDAYDIVINGLRRLEYRGYDSAGIVTAENNGHFNVVKTKGKVDDLVGISENMKGRASFGIGHTRWATHGVPSDTNSHPHVSNNGKIALVHNGIIENYDTIKTMLISKGYTFQSETDTEVLVNLIQYIMETQTEIDFPTAVRYALNEVYGAYAISVMHEDYPGIMVAARLGSPLAIGLGEKEYFIASDASPFVEFTKEAIYLEEGHMATISLKDGVDIRVIVDNTKVEAPIQELKLSLEQIEKGGYEHFMLKEMYEQPKAITDTVAPRIKEEQIVIEELGMSDEEIKSIQKIMIVACGSAYHAGVTSKYIFEGLARIPVEVDVASEFRYRDPILGDGTLVLIISQSGETADSLAALREAKRKGSKVLGIVNVVGSSIAREADNVMYTWAGPEIAVATTKAYSSQLAALYLLAMKFAGVRGKTP